MKDHEESLHIIWTVRGEEIEEQQDIKVDLAKIWYD